MGDRLVIAAEFWKDLRVADSLTQGLVSPSLHVGAKNQYFQSRLIELRAVWVPNIRDGRSS
jgi:hypothetical protein